MINLNSGLKEITAKYGVTIALSAFLLFMAILIVINDNTILNIGINSILWFLIYTIVGIFLLSIITILFKRHKQERDSWWHLFTTNSFHYAMIWLIPIIGVLGYVLIYNNWLCDSTLKDVVEKIADVFVIGGVVGFLSNSSHFFGLFTQELEDIIYSNRFLSLRRDISKVWHKVSTAMFDSKFPNISEDLFSIIENSYICCKANSYYDNYYLIMDVKWADERKKELIIKDYISFDLVTDKEGDIKLSFACSFREVQNLKKDEDYYCRINKFMINDSDYLSKLKDESTEGNQNDFIDKRVISIDNSKREDRYAVLIERERKCIFDLDYDIGFKAKYIVKNMRVSLSLPEDLSATFIERGTTKNFEFVKNDKHQKDLLYKGLILQKQGFIFVMHRNERN